MKITRHLLSRWTRSVPMGRLHLVVPRYQLMLFTQAGSRSLLRVAVADVNGLPFLAAWTLDAGAPLSAPYTVAIFRDGEDVPGSFGLQGGHQGSAAIWDNGVEVMFHVFLTPILPAECEAFEAQEREGKA